MGKETQNRSRFCSRCRELSLMPAQETNTLSQVVFSAKLDTQTFHSIRVKGPRRSVETPTRSFRVDLFEWTRAQPLLKLFFDRQLCPTNRAFPFRSNLWLLRYVCSTDSTLCHNFTSDKWIYKTKRLFRRWIFIAM